MLDGLEVDTWPVGIAVSEAVTNVVLHAYRQREPGWIRATASIVPDLLTVVVSDGGVCRV
jgi:anti-sigma regulatory factor (Ser/Thr protein kinase)